MKKLWMHDTNTYLYLQSSRCGSVYQVHLRGVKKRKLLLHSPSQGVKMKNKQVRAAEFLDELRKTTLFHVCIVLGVNIQYPCFSWVRVAILAPLCMILYGLCLSSYRYLLVGARQREEASDSFPRSK